jgi:DNA-binding transcriptional MocR family regulator
MNDTNWKPGFEGSDQSLYVWLSRAISTDVERGVLKVGTRLPTHREMADTLGVAVGTVTRAYSEAERRGLIRGEGRRGTFVGPPQTSRSILSAMVRGSAHGVDLSKNHPSNHLDPDLAGAIRRIAREKEVQALLEYPPAAGMEHHREAGAKWLNQLGAAAEPESVFITAGAQHALSVVFAAETRRGDIIAAENLTYPGVRAVAEQFDLQTVGISTDEQGLIPDALESVCRQRSIRLLYCNPSVSNPTNTLSSLSRRQGLATVAEKYGLTIVEDEIMRPLLPEHPGFIADLLPEQTYLVISASKAVAAGLRVGFVRAPVKSHQKMVDSLNASCLGVPPLMAELFSTWLEDGTIDAIVARRRSDTSARQKLAAELLAGFRHRGHPVSYHVWLELPEGWTGMKLAHAAQARGTSVTPAEAFAVDNRSPVNAVRLSLVMPPTLDLLRSGLKTIIDLLRGNAGHEMATV